MENTRKLFLSYLLSFITAAFFAASLTSEMFAVNAFYSRVISEILLASGKRLKKQALPQAEAVVYHGQPHTRSFRNNP